FYDYNDQGNSLEETQTIETPQPSDNNFLVNEIINVDNPEEATNDTEFNFVNNEKNGKKFADIWNYISYNNSKKRVCKKCSYVFSDKSGNSSIEQHMYLDEYSIIQELNPPQTNSQYNYRKYFQQLKNHKSNNQSPQPSTLERVIENIMFII
ncbi:11224_t:CDS:2, partial [Entrophospora sp. SA101]